MSKFEIYESKNGFRWRLKAGNGEIIANGEEYSTKEAAVKGCRTVAEAASAAEIIT